MATITLAYRGADSYGVFTKTADVPQGIWIRLRNAAVSADSGARILDDSIELSWRSALDILRLHSASQTELGFEFDTDSSSVGRIKTFMDEFRNSRSVAGKLTTVISVQQISEQLRECGWNFLEHDLKPYQLENLMRLLSMRNGANFSVPGAGKTTVTFALHLLLPKSADFLLVVAPRNAFQAWEEVVEECLTFDAPPLLKEPFRALTGGERRIDDALGDGGSRFIISYDQLVRVEALFQHLLSTRRVHLVLDESHRMKGGSTVLRGAVLLKMGHLAARRDILSGTPMPQSSLDVQSQLDFLWPGSGLGSRIATGEPPRNVLSGLYVRTTKQQLGLEPRERISVPVSLTPAHLAFYAVLKDDVRARASDLRRGASAVALIQARRSVMRLLQASVNPQLVAQLMERHVTPDRAGLLRAVIEDGSSARVRGVADLVMQLAAENKKVLVWTIFTSTIHQLKSMLSHLEPAVIFGETAVGEESDDSTRQGQIRRFKTSSNCKVMIANPAAASEGMSLHMHCHDAVYVDRSYNATHFLQSVDRIHRLGLPAGTKTTVFVMENRLPAGVGSIDLSVARRLAKKIRAMEQLLQDEDLHQLALDEEEMMGSLEESIDAQDIDDLVAELENRAPPSEDDGLV